MNINSGKRRKREAHTTTKTHPFKTKFGERLRQGKKSKIEISNMKENDAYLIPFTTCIRTLPFLKNSSGKQTLLFILNFLESLYREHLTPGNMLKYYYNFCTCEVE